MIEDIAPVVKIWAYLSGTWVDLTADWMVNETTTCSWGMPDNYETTRLASAGEFRFVLNNISGQYSTGNVSHLTGFEKGAEVYLEMTYDSVAYRRFYGRISRIEIDAGTTKARRTRVTVLDWMDYAENHPLINFATQTNQRAGVAINTILANMPIQPLAKDIDAGISVFPALFDTITTYTQAYGEFSKIVMSEMGYIYLRKDRVNGETLVFESRNHRSGLDALTPVPLVTSESDILITEDGDTLVTEDGFTLVVNDAATLHVDNTQIDMDTTDGDQFINRMRVVAYPKKVDTTNQVLYSLPSPILIGAVQSVSFRAGYTDPIGTAASVNAIDGSMVTPVATTDYLLNTLEDGTGTDLTANLVVTAVYGTEGVDYTLLNSGIDDGYVIKLQARGKGIYAYNPIETNEESSVSYNKYGYSSQVIDQKYQRDLTYGTLTAKSILDAHKEPHLDVNAVSLNANRSNAAMQAFLNLDVGDMVHISDTQTGIDGWYYIQGVEFQVFAGGVIMFTWIVKEHLSLSDGMSMIVAEMNNATPYEDMLDFGYVPNLCNLGDFSLSAWIYMAAYPSYGTSSTIIANFLYRSGYHIVIGTAHEIVFLQYGTNDFGAWDCGDISSLNTWVHIAVTRTSGISSSSPIIYQDGSSIVVNQVAAQSGEIAPQNGSHITIGNRHRATGYDWPLKGKLKDVRIYNRILTAAEVAAIHTEGAGGTGVTDGLVFQAPVVRTTDYDYFTDRAMTSDDKLIDNINGIVGEPHGSPVTRAP